MKKNVGSTDKIVRIILGIAMGYFAYTTSFETAWYQTALYVVAAILLITALLGSCPAFSLLKINTCKTKK
jgi:hypothetical protein